MHRRCLYSLTRSGLPRRRPQWELEQCLMDEPQWEEVEEYDVWEIARKAREELFNNIRADMYNWLKNDAAPVAESEQLPETD